MEILGSFNNYIDMSLLSENRLNLNTESQSKVVLYCDSEK